MVWCRMEQNILNFTGINFFYVYCWIWVLSYQITTRGRQSCVGSFATLLLQNTVYRFTVVFFSFKDMM